MPSSATTPTRRDHPVIPLWLVVRGDDHPKACTGRRLLRRGAVRLLHNSHGATRPIALDPYAPTVLSPRDRPYAERHGLLVLDCSWNRLSERGQLGPEPEPREVRRRLPFLLATNPQHYGRVGQLNSAEAFGAALAVLDHEPEGRALLASFHGGPAFFEVNASRLRRYRAAGNSRAVLAAERGAFAGPA